LLTNERVKGIKLRTKSDWQQTGFRANKKLLNRFRSKLALQELDMGSVIEEFIRQYVQNEVPVALVKGAEGPECSIVNRILAIVRQGGPAAELMVQTANTLYALVVSSDGKVDTGTQHNPDNSAEAPVTSAAIEAVERMATDIEEETGEGNATGGAGAATHKSTRERRKRVGG